ncbi:MAG: preprotein translocase subunit YajC [Candidatus Scalindua sp.]|nr:preprotein translocase subunit YajC [Candidatus Scalindua sp.]MBT5305096.1 preprotein translocase subunit YajC [Candidatus Scalindua sp.]MBT6046560.1 preprotein translocase subunit YajC [Candidatus Scalindua sp.]MBT6226586.1 preprotein translocase subunit YajC [Candidatus Scalindua sp.]MBT6562233.1 preprotein translocase subunit YajC [Candidatus Scalindua sp.]
MEFLMQNQANVGPMKTFLPLMIIMFAVMYFLIIRPQKQKEKKRLEMITNVRKQDRIVTAGGVHGVVVTVKENDVIIRVDDAKDVKIKVDKSAITSVSVPKGEKEEA